MELIIILFLITICYLPERQDCNGIIYPELRTELLTMLKADQEIREKIIKLSKESGESKDMEFFRSVQEKSNSIDKANTERLKEIIKKIDWPEPTKVGTDGQEAAFLIIQHSNSQDFMEEMLPVIEMQYKAGKISGQSFALIKDRVLVNRGNPQLYGTQASIQQGKLTFPPIKDYANVDKRRSEVGLPLLAEYRAKLKSQMTNQQ